jgi:signal peptidase I
VAANLDDDIEIIYWGDDETDEIVNSSKFQKKKRKQDSFEWKKELVSFIKLMLIAVIIAFAINNLVIINATVPTGSMEQTIHKKSRMIGFRLAYTFSSPKRGDIIIFKFPDNHNENFVKRVIGLPGEYVEIKSGVVYIYESEEDEVGTALEEDYLYYEGGKIDLRGDFSKTYIPEGCYFVLGDNRNNSKDSRFWTTTNFVKEDEILGEAIFCYYPSFKLLK